MDKAIHWLNFYPADNAIVSLNSYLLDSDLSSGEHYPMFGKLGPDGGFSFTDYYLKNKHIPLCNLLCTKLLPNSREFLVQTVSQVNCNNDWYM